MMFVYIFSKDKHIASIYGDDVRIMQDYKIINVFNKNDLIASIDFEEVRETRKDTYIIYIDENECINILNVSKISIKINSKDGVRYV